MLLLVALILAVAFFAWFLYVWVPDALERSIRGRR